MPGALDSDPTPPPLRSVEGGAPWNTDVHVANWQTGDEAAFDLLYHRFLPLLRSRILRTRTWGLVRHAHSMEDVIQEVWTRALPPAHSSFTSSGPGSFLAFLGKVSDNTLGDLVRRATASKRGRGIPAQPLGEVTEKEATRLPGLARTETPTSRARANELLVMTSEVLEPRELEIWTFVVLEHRTYAEVGLALDCTESAARGVLHRAKLKLLRRLAQDSGQEPPNE